MAVVLALVSAAAYGISDFLGGIFSRRTTAWRVAVVGQSSSAACTLAVTAVVGSAASARDLWWGAAAGAIGGGVGVAFLYRGLSTGRMSVVAPISAIGSAVVPVAVGLVTGDRPTSLAWLGIVFAFPAIYLISRVSDDPTATANTGSGVLDGVIAGLGFGAMFALLGQVDDDAGLLPLVLTQLGSVAAIIVTATALRASWVPRDRSAWRAVMMGPFGATATGAFLYATHSGLLTIVSVVTALYPALTVVLATVVLREHIHRGQAIGLALAATAVSLVAAG